MASVVDMLGARRARRRWAAARGGDLREMATLMRELRGLRSEADALLRAGERRMSARAGTMALPAQADWGWRPEPWSAALMPGVWAGVAGGTVLAPGVKLFHDCPLAEIAIRQERVADAGARAPYRLAMDVLGFEGSFLSLAIDLPAPGVAGLGPAHIVEVAALLRQERRAEVFARLNVRHGPNTETLVHEFDMSAAPGGAVETSFDLGLEEINPRKVTHAWLDLIFEGPAMNAIALSDLTLTRRPRADI